MTRLGIIYFVGVVFVVVAGSGVELVGVTAFGQTLVTSTGCCCLAGVA
jgi:hypothetical protein